MPGGKRTALVIIDVQNDFCDGGALAVPDGTAVVAGINKLRQDGKWDLVVLTQDWHPSDHVSFSANNPGTKVFETIQIPDVGEQVMWPVHCVQGSDGAKFHPDLVTDVGTTMVAGDTVPPSTPELDAKDFVVRKGTHPKVDSYSGFGDATENKSKEKTPLLDLLKSRDITDVVCAGLAQDFCVGFTARDARQSGFETALVTDLTRGITPEGIKAEMERCTALGVKLVKAADLVDAKA